MTRDVLAEEAEAYSAFGAAVEAVPRDRHVEFEARAAGTFEEVDYPAEVTDATNARVLAEGRTMSLEDVEAQAAVIRARMLEAFAGVTADADAVETFRSETTEHYEEHLPALRAAFG